MLIYAHQSLAWGAVVNRCRRCGRSGLEATIAFCVGCHAQEEVVRHLPPAQRWLLGR